MKRLLCLPVCFRRSLLLAACLVIPPSVPQHCRAEEQEPQGDWIELFDGRSLAGWRASENEQSWRVEGGLLIANGPRSHLFYLGEVPGHDWRNFELQVEARTEAGANSGVYFHTQYEPGGWPSRGYEVQISNSHRSRNADRKPKRSGSLYGVRNIYKAQVADGQWFRLRIGVIGPRIRIWVDQWPVVDYVEPQNAPRPEKQSGRVLSRGTIALQAHDQQSRVEFRSIQVRVLADDADPFVEPRASDAGYGIAEGLMDRLAGRSIPVIDFHVHLRGGMTAEKALARQAVTGINIGVVRNVGRGWPVETNEQLREYLDGVAGMPLFVGVQVNDRDWMEQMDGRLRQRLDFVLADTMIMPMPDDSSPPVKLWMPDQYTIADPEQWMERYMRHNLRVVSEPIDILANPTYLPPPVEHLYDQLWTDERMRQLIRTAIDNHVALEINTRSRWPGERFIRMAKQMGAKFTFGSNNFDDRAIDMSRCLEAIEQFGLEEADMFVPDRRLP